MVIMCILHYKVIATLDCCKIIIIIIRSNSNGISSSSGSSNITLNISGKKSLKKKKICIWDKKITNEK